MNNIQNRAHQLQKFELPKESQTVPRRILLPSCDSLNSTPWGAFCWKLSLLASASCRHLMMIKSKGRFRNGSVLWLWINEDLPFGIVLLKAHGCHFLFVVTFRFQGHVSLMGLNSLIFHMIVTDSEANCRVDDAFSFIAFTTFRFFLEILRIVLMNEHLGVVNSSLVKNICHLCCSLIPLVSEIKTWPSFQVSTISIFNLPLFFSFLLVVLCSRWKCGCPNLCCLRGFIFISYPFISMFWNLFENSLRKFWLIVCVWIPKIIKKN